jgi:hypothetical protein
LLRLRRRLAEGVKPDLIGIPGEREPELKSLSTKDVSILYVEANKRDRIPREIKVGKAFQFEDLPKGFMNQAIEDRLGIMQALKKR